MIFPYLYRKVIALNLFFSLAFTSFILASSIPANSVPGFVDATISVGDQWSQDTTAGGSTVNNEDITYEITAGPVGLEATENTGLLTFRPTSNQVGSYSMTLRVKHRDGTFVEFTRTLTVQASAVSDPVGLYVAPSVGQDSSSNGSASNPYKTIKYAFEHASAGDTIFIRGGVYTIHDKIDAVGTNNNPITLKPLPGERVRLLFDTNIGLNVVSSAKHIIIDGLEIDGGTDALDHWDVIARGFWRQQDVQDGGGSAIHIEGQHITVQNCIIHDCFQKGVNITSGRYITVRQNIIYNIAHASLSGGHGIMRKWEYNFGNADISNLYRFDFYGNLIFDVEQRIYSWVPKKNYCNMVLDEGKSILIDKTTDNDLKARVAHNIVAFGNVDHIRLKRTPNLKVYNNSVYTNTYQPMADGITDKEAIPNLKFYNNAVMAVAGQTAIDVKSTQDAGAFATNHPKNNYIAGGGSNFGSVSGITDLGPSVNLFTDPENGDFSPSASMPAGIGVGATERAVIYDLVQKYGIRVKSTGWVHDHKRMTQTILDNVPTDIFSNPTFGDSIKEPGRKSIFYDVDTTDAWAIDNQLGPKHEFILPDEYANWYIAHNQQYDYGTRTIAGDHTLASNYTLFMELGGRVIDTEYNRLTVQGTCTLGGTLKVELINNFSPIIGDSFTLVSANNITGSFATLDLPNLPSGQKWISQQTPTDYKIKIIADSALGDWREANGLAADGSQDTQDASGNGIPNLLYFAFDLGDPTNPTPANTSNMGTLVSVDHPNDPNLKALKFSFIRRINATADGIAYTPQYSDDLDVWKTEAQLANAEKPISTNISPINADYERVDIILPAVPNRRFCRITIDVL